MSILGNRVLRKEDPKLLTSGGVYVSDLKFDGMLYAGYVTSSMAFAKILTIDVTEALDLEGVVAVFVNSDLEIPPPPPPRMFNAAMARKWLADDYVRYAGDPIALVVATSQALVEDAIERVFVEFEPLEAVIDPLVALRDETLLFPEAGTNIATTFAGDFSDKFFDDADVVVRSSFVNQRLAPAPLEVRGALARWLEDDRCEFYISTQVPHSHRDQVADALGVDKEMVRVITPDVGGGFGAKGTVYIEEILIACVSRVLGRPIRWVETRSQSMMGLGHGRAQHQRIELGATREGIITGYRLDVVQDAGAYPMVGAFLPYLTKVMGTGVYQIPKYEFNSVSVLTNTTPIVSYRGAGRPEATAAIERAIDLLSNELGMDPAELRLKNFIRPDQFPYQSAAGSNYDVGDYSLALEVLLERSDYKGLRELQARRVADKDPILLGLGLSTYVEVTNPFPSGEFARVEILKDAKAIVYTGTSPHGQGHDTSWSMIVCETLGIAMEDIEVVHGDTDRVARGVGTFGSRSLQVGGSAVLNASEEIADKARELAASLLEADPADVVFDVAVGGAYIIGTKTKAVTWAKLYEASSTKGIDLFAEVDFNPDGSTYPFGAHLAVVEVDSETGKVSILRMIAVDDAGRLLNPLLAEGQVQGGLGQGIAQALLEEVAYDEYGNPTTSNFSDYGVISATELPLFEVFHTQTPTPRNPLGAKGIGESGTIGSTPAVWNAVIDALSVFGVTTIEMPTTPMRVWQAISTAKKN